MALLPLRVMNEAVTFLSDDENTERRYGHGRGSSFRKLIFAGVVFLLLMLSLLEPNLALLALSFGLWIGVHSAYAEKVKALRKKAVGMLDSEFDKMRKETARASSKSFPHVGQTLFMVVASKF